MKILVLKSVNINLETESCDYDLEIKEGLDIHDGDNYIRSLVECDYNVDFDYKEIYFHDNLIIESLTYYFEKQYQNGKSITYDELHKMFIEHMDLRDTDIITKIKRICIEYAIQKLKENDFE